MAFSASKVNVVGNIAADAELREAGGKSVCDFRVCANVYRGKDKDDTAVWYKVTLWEKYAEIMAPLLKKGGMVYVHGDLITEEFKKKDGDAGFSLVILNPEVIVLGSRDKSENKSSRNEKRSERFPRD